MFKTLNEVPEPIRPFYFEDVVSEPTGEMVEVPFNYVDENGDEQSGVQSVPEMHDVTYIKLEDFGQTDGNPSILLRRNEVESRCLEVLRFANNAQDKRFYDSYIGWMESEPFQENYTKLEPNYDEAVTQELVYDQATFTDAYQTWIKSEPTKPRQKTLNDYPEYTRYLKLQGIEFEGVMCSATQKDYWGLGIAFDSIRAGVSTVWDFDNGNHLLLTPDNIEEFKSVWLPFRLSFFD